jgi:hypothetical protein
VSLGGRPGCDATMSAASMGTPYDLRAAIF